MPLTDAVVGEEGSTGGVRVTRPSVSGVNAHLRLIPRDPSDFQVVVTFHHTDGSLCEAQLKPFEAAELMSEIARAIDRGNASGPHGRSNEMREVHYD